MPLVLYYNEGINGIAPQDVCGALIKSWACSIKSAVYTLESTKNCLYAGLSVNFSSQNPTQFTRTIIRY